MRVAEVQRTPAQMWQRHIRSNTDALRGWVHDNSDKTSDRSQKARLLPRRSATVLRTCVVYLAAPAYRSTRCDRPRRSHPGSFATGTVLSRLATAPPARSRRQPAAGHGPTAVLTATPAAISAGRMGRRGFVLLAAISICS